jgi:cytochrome P450
MVLMSQNIMHRDPRLHPEPQRFDPERWQTQVATTRPKFSYFPFGGGTRICIGEQFAWMEGILILATIAQRWKLHYLGSSPPAIEPRITLRPAGSVSMRIDRR